MFLVLGAVEAEVPHTSSLGEDILFDARSECLQLIAKCQFASAGIAINLQRLVENRLCVAREIEFEVYRFSIMAKKGINGWQH